MEPEDFTRYLTESTTSLRMMIRRYDDANQFFKSELYQALGLPNICDEVPQPWATQPKPTALATDAFLEELRQINRSDRTLKSYGQTLADLVVEAPTLPPTMAQLERVIGDHADCRTNTRRRHYAVLSSFFDSATYQALGLENVLTQSRRPRRWRSKSGSSATLNWMCSWTAPMT